jgi:hypothetical protein
MSLPRDCNRRSQAPKPGRHVILSTAGALEPTEDSAQPTADPSILRIFSQRAPIQVGLSCQLQLSHRRRSPKPVLLGVGVELKRKSPLDIKPEQKIIVWFDSQAK